MMNSRCLLLVLLTLVHASVLAADDTVNSKSEVVNEFLAAFNAQDAERMGALVTDNVKWLSVVDGQTSVEVEGRSNLTEAMAGYFSACPSCRSSISKMMPSQDRVSVIEVASWDSDGVRKSQQAMAVYEFSG